MNCGKKEMAHRWLILILLVCFVEVLEMLAKRTLATLSRPQLWSQLAQRSVASAVRLSSFYAHLRLIFVDPSRF